MRDEDFLSEEVQKQQKAISKILQNYARSGLFEDICLVEEKNFKSLFMPEVSLLEYDNVLSQTLAKMINMVNWLQNEESLYSEIEPPNEACRIKSLGVFAEAEERLVFPLDNVRQKDVYFACSKETLKTDTDLLEKIKETLKKMKGGAVPFIPEIGLLFDNMKYFGTGVVNMFSDKPIIVSGNTPHNVPPNPSAQFLRKDTHPAAHVRPNLHNIYKQHYGD